METITDVLTEDHRYADDLFATAARYAEQSVWNECERQLALFRAALESHMKIEEDVLFPAFEHATGSKAGPTAVMRHEHREMLALLDDIAGAAEAGDQKRFEALAQSFLTVLNMHSAKEENVLYPMCDTVVDTLDGPGLRQTLQKLRSGASSA
jgi:iron-sulfur cluster repair protein YtfE (RIC family)